MKLPLIQQLLACGPADCDANVLTGLRNQAGSHEGRWVTKLQGGAPSELWHALGQHQPALNDFSWSNKPPAYQH